MRISLWSVLTVCFVFIGCGEEEEDTQKPVSLELIPSNPDSDQTGEDQANTAGDSRTIRYGLVDKNINNYPVTELGADSAKVLGEDFLPLYVFPRMATKSVKRNSIHSVANVQGLINSFGSTLTNQKTSLTGNFPNACRNFTKRETVLFNANGEDLDLLTITTCKIEKFAGQDVQLDGIKCSGANFDALKTTKETQLTLQKIYEISSCDPQNPMNSSRGLLIQSKAQPLEGVDEKGMIAASTTELEMTSDTGHCSVKEERVNGIPVVNHSPCRYSMLVSVFNGLPENIDKEFTGDQKTTGPFYLSLSVDHSQHLSAGGAYADGSVNMMINQWRGSVDFSKLSNPRIAPVQLSLGDLTSDLILEQPRN